MKAHLVSVTKTEIERDRSPTVQIQGGEDEASSAANPGILKGPKRRISRKMLAVLIAASAVIASAAAAWVVFLRPWSTEEVGDHVIDDPTSNAPGFKHSLAGRTVTVAGKLTTIEQYNTTKGPIHLLTLDDYAYIRLVIWGPTSYKIGDHVSMPVRFDWATCNDERHVYSPQIDFPWFYLLSIGVVVEAVSNVAGTAFTAQDIGDGQLRLTVLDHFPEHSTALVNCTLMEGERTWEGEYIDVLGVWNYGHIIDELASLANTESENGLVSYSDSNHDGNLSRGDWFDIRGIERPSEIGGVKSYMLNVGFANDAFNPGGVCYLVLTHDGLLRMVPEGPYMRIALNNRTDGSVEAKVVVLSNAVSWENITIQLYDGNQWETWSPRTVQLLGTGPTSANLGDAALGSLSIYCVAQDQEGNGLVDEGDSVVFGVNSGSFSPNTNYTVSMIWEPTQSQMCTSRTFHG